MSDRWAGTAWRIVAVGDLAIDGEASMVFDDEARVSGSGGVNRFMGGYTVEGDQLRFGMLATTMMMGPPERMVEEDAVLAAFGEPLTLLPDGMTLQGTTTTVRLAPLEV